MAEFAFDTSAFVLSPAVPASLPPAANTRSSARFEDHLGKAGRSPRDHSADSSQRLDDREPSSPSASANGARPDDSRPPEDDRQNQPVEAAKCREDGDDAEQDASEQDDSADASAAAEAAAAAQTADKTPSKHLGKGRAEKSHTDDETVGGDAIDISGKGAQARRGKHIAGEAVDDPSANGELVGGADKGKADPAVDKESAAEKGAAEQNLGGLEAAAESAAGATTNAPLAGSVVATAGSANGETTPGPGEEATKDSLAAAQSIDSARSSGRARSKQEAATAQRNAPQSSDEKLAVAAASVAAVEEVAASIAGDGDESATGHDRSPDDKAPADRNESNENRIGAAPALLAARADKGHEPNGRAEGLTEAERVRFVQRVAGAFRSLGDEGGEVRLRLSPPELGSLRVELTVRDGVLNARLEAETSSARNVLLDNLPALRDRLAEQNIKVEKFDVDVRDERRQSSGEQFTGQHDQASQQDRQRTRTFHNGTTAVSTTRPGRAVIKHGDASELNIVI